MYTYQNYDSSGIQHCNFYFEFFTPLSGLNISFISRQEQRDSVMSYWQPLLDGGQQYDVQANPALVPGGHLGGDQQAPIFQGGKHLRN
jgi:hypothetical protein